MTPHKLPRKRRFSPADFLLFAFFSAALAGCACLFAAASACAADQGLVVRIYDQHAGTVYAEAPAHVGSRLFFGWIHSLEKIPWHEYYLVDEKGNLELQAIAFPAFGAGIPADAGRVCFVRDGLIHMEEIGQVFTELRSGSIRIPPRKTFCWTGRRSRGGRICRITRR